MEIVCPDRDYCSSSAVPGVLDLSLRTTEELQSELASLRSQMEDMAISNKFS